MTLELKKPVKGKKRNSGVPAARSHLPALSPPRSVSLSEIDALFERNRCARFTTSTS